MKTTLIAGLVTVLSALGQTPDEAALRARELEALKAQVQSLATSALSQTPDEAALRAWELDALKAQVQILATSVLSRSAPVRNAPYSADAMTETTQVLADGNRIIRRTTQKLYRDSDGRERREESVLAVGALAQVEAPRVITISDPIGKVSYTLDPRNHIARVSGNATPGAGRPKSLNTDRLGSDLVKEDLGSKNIEGVIARGARVTETIPPGQIGNEFAIRIVDEIWHSPELQINVMTTHTDPRSGEVIYKLTHINRANPSRALFELPADYTIDHSTAGRRGGRGNVPDLQK